VTGYNKQHQILHVDQTTLDKNLQSHHATCHGQTFCDTNADARFVCGRYLSCFNSFNTTTDYLPRVWEYWLWHIVVAHCNSLNDRQLKQCGKFTSLKKYFADSECTEPTITNPTDESEHETSDVVRRRLQDENRRQDSVKTDLVSQLEQQMKQRQSKISMLFILLPYCVHFMTLMPTMCLDDKPLSFPF